MHWLTHLADPACTLELYAGRAELSQECLGPRTLDRHVLFLVLDGRYDAEVDGRAFRVDSGDLLWLPAGSRHVGTSKAPVRKYFLRLKTDAGIPVKGQLARRLGEEAVVWCQAMVAEQRMADSLSSTRVRALVTLLVSAWMRAGTRPIGGLNPERRTRLIELVTGDPSRRWRRGEIAKVLGISPLHLARQVRRSFGMPLRTWLVDTRIRAAANDLREHDGPIGKLSLRYGYEEPFLFSRQFRQILGISPRRWREDA
jgi:AraC family transcriptional regulator of arabinose operon